MDKVAIVTGASSGLGLSLAGKLYNRGYLLGVCARRTPQIPGVNPYNAIIASLNVCNLSHIKQFVAKVYMAYGRIDILINNAGYCHPLKDIENITTRETQETFETNVLAPIYFMRLVIPIMKKQKNGMIINISSRSGLTANSKLSVYSASKAALNVLGDSVNKSLAETGVKCYTISPGPMNTRMRQDIVGDAIQHTEPSQVADIIMNMIEEN